MLMSVRLDHATVIFMHLTQQREARCAIERIVTSSVGVGYLVTFVNSSKMVYHRLMVTSEH